MLQTPILQTLDRRALLSGSLSLGALASSVALGGCEDFWNKIRNRPVRRNVATLDPNGQNMTSFRTAIAAMKALPASDPRNWTKQAQIHNNFCPHGNWYFLPWHRAYLFYFEAICRQLSGDASFALPYWHWQLSPSIPGAFWGGASNQLFDGTRVATASSVADPTFTGADALQGVLDNTDFQLFGSPSAPAPRGSPRVYGALEATPHNYIHGTFVQGDMSAFMSPLDPIFWCHHGMIDCMWVAWNIRCGNANTNDSTWANYTYTEFCDAGGAPVSLKSIVTVLMPLLSYRYDDPLIGHGTCPSGSGPISTAPPPPSPPPGPRRMRKFDEIDKTTLKAFLEKGAPSRLEIASRVPLAQGLQLATGKPQPVRATLAKDALAPVFDGRQRLLLTIGKVQEPPGKDTFLRAFVNLPAADASTLTSDPHYAGSFSFFGTGGEAMPGMAAMAAQGVGFLVDVSETVRRLKSMNMLGDEGAVALTLVPVPIPGVRAAPSAFAVGEVSLAFSPVFRGQ